MPISNIMLGPQPEAMNNKEVRSVLSWLPIVGTAIDVDTAVKDPTPTNIGFAAGSVGLDILSGGLASRTLKGINRLKRVISKGTEDAVKAEKKYKQAQRIYNHASNERNYQRFNDAQRKYWDAYDKVHNTSDMNAFNGQYWRELDDLEQKYFAQKFGSTMGGTIMEGVNQTYDSVTEDNSRRRLESRGSKTK